MQLPRITLPTCGLERVHGVGPLALRNVIFCLQTVQFTAHHASQQQPAFLENFADATLASTQRLT